MKYLISLKKKFWKFWREFTFINLHLLYKKKKLRLWINTLATFMMIVGEHVKIGEIIGWNWVFLFVVSSEKTVGWGTSIRVTVLLGSSSRCRSAEIWGNLGGGGQAADFKWCWVRGAEFHGLDEWSKRGSYDFPKWPYVSRERLLILPLYYVNVCLTF